MKAVNPASATNNPGLASTPGRAAPVPVGLVLVSELVGEAAAVGVWTALEKVWADEVVVVDEDPLMLNCED